MGRLGHLARDVENLARQLHEDDPSHHAAHRVETVPREPLLNENMGLIFVGIASAFIVVTLIGGLMMLRNSTGNTAKYTILMGSLTFVSSIVCCLWFNKEAIIAGVVLALTFIGFVYKKDLVSGIAMSPLIITLSVVLCQAVYYIRSVNPELKT